MREDEAEATQPFGIAIARGENPRVRGVKGSVLGIILEKDGEIQLAKIMELKGPNEELADKWITINQDREVRVLED